MVPDLDPHPPTCFFPPSKQFCIHLNLPPLVPQLLHPPQQRNEENLSSLSFPLQLHPSGFSGPSNAEQEPGAGEAAAGCERSGRAGPAELHLHAD